MRWPRKDINKLAWHTWFAWYPVRYCGQLVWLEHVQRRGHRYAPRGWAHTRWEYK